MTRELKPYRFFLLLFILFTAIGLNINAQNNRIRFHHYTANDGLSQNMVDCILKDSKGFMWFGTWNGLNRFDGYEFTTFKHTNTQKNSIANNFVYCLDEDIYGNIWLGTRNGLTVFQYPNNEFKNFSHEPNSTNSIVSNTINDLICDEKGNLWLATPMGLNKVKTNKNGNIESVQYLPCESNNMGCLYLDKDQKLWIGTDNGVYFLDKNLHIKPFYFATPLTDYVINTIYIDQHDLLWIGTNIGLVKINREKNKTTIYNLNPEDNSTIVHDAITSLTEDIEGNLLIGTLGGLCIYNRQENNFTRFTHELNASHSLNNDFINCMLADEKGNIWIGTERGGINKYSVYQMKFEYLENEPGNPNSLNNKTVNSILEDNKYIWIGTAGGGINRYDKTTKTFKHFVFQADNPSSLSSNFIPTLYQDSKNNMWIGSWGGGLHLLTPENKNKGIFIHYRQTDTTDNGLINDFVSTIIGDRFGNLWIGTRGGLNKFIPEQNKFEYVSGNNEVGKIVDVGTLLFDKWDNLWVGTIPGLYKLISDTVGQISSNPSDIIYFTSDQENENSLSGNYVISMCSDKNNDIWVGTYGGGLNKFELDSQSGKIDKIIRFNENDGISNNVIYTIIEDKNGTLWMGTDNGLTKFNPDTKKSRNYLIEDGLQSNQFYWSAAYKNNQGKLYFGCMNGLNSFYPDSIEDFVTNPTVTITDFKIYNNSVIVGEKYNDRVVLDKAITHADEIVISYRSNEFSFEFSALDYDQPEKYQYAYRMHNFENKWTYVNSKRRFANYTNLEGGDYIFQVKAANSLGSWDTNITSVKIKIIPPFWATWWFKIIFVFVTIIIIIAYIYIRTYNLTRQKKKLENLVNERTAKIEEQKEELRAQANHLQDTNLQLEKRQIQIETQNEEILEQRDKLIEMNKKVQAVNQRRIHFFTNISHEFRTPLTLILSPLELLVEKTDLGYDIKQKVLLMYKNAKRLLNLINQLMELRKVETGKLDLKAKKDNIIKFVTNISQSFLELSYKRNLNFIVYSKLENLEMFFDHEKIEIIVYNLLSNALKYTPEEGTVNLDISKKDLQRNEYEDYVPIVDRGSYQSGHSDEFIEIKVTDSGIGVDKEQIKQIFKMFYRDPSIEGTHVHGTGIGLSLVKELVKTHRGLLFVKSKKNKGSTFSVLLPTNEKYLLPEEKVEDNVSLAIDIKNEHLSKKNTPISDVDTNDITKQYQPLVLIVEDNPDMRTFLNTELQNSFRTLEAINGKEGLEMARLHSPDIIISDIMMPVMDGLELCAKIKDDITTSHIPIILLTSKSSIEDHIKGYNIGADDYIPKPFNTALLKSRIQNILKNKESIKKLFNERVIPEPKKITTNKVDEKFLREAITVVTDNYQIPEFSVGKFASQMNMSRSMLHKKLVAIVGNSPTDFINSIRMNKAVNLLLNSGININEVAYKVGFNDPKYFSRCFKKQFNKTPTEFIKEHT